MSDIDVYKEWLGIPADVRPPDHYTLLRLVMFEDDAEKVRANYRKLNAHVRKYATGQYLLRSQELLNELAKAMLCLTDPDGKVEYDRSLGREAPAVDESETRTVLQYLVARSLIKRGQVSEIEHFAEARGLSHRDAVIQMKLVEPPDACRALAAELRLSYADLEDMLPDDSVLDRIPRRVVKRHSCLPLFEDRGCILVACSDEPSHELEEEIRIRCGVPMRAVLAVPRAINQAIAKYYAPGMREEAAEDVPAKSANGKEAKSGKPEKTVQKPAAKEVRSKSAPLTEDQKRERLMITAIATCWSIIGTVGLFWFLNNGVVGVPQIMIGVVAGAVVFGLMKATYAR
ncbi:MAG TPA: general secretion pathway protein GspE [Planctomycetaceae bacterium]|nr:general secretion pathway protein GspE [Planctomycetaceae bacterium]